MSLTLSQERALSIVPKFTGIVGFVSSAIVIAEIVATHRRNRGNPILRAVLGMSVFYMLDAFAWALSTWLVPRSSGFAYAAGSLRSCEFQGFWLQAVIAAPLYTAVMALYFYLVSCHGKSSDDLAKIETYIHGFVLLFSLGTGFAFLGKDLYNQIGAICWVNGSPPQCGHSTFDGFLNYDSNPENYEVCERGDYAWMYGMLLFYTPLWICILLLSFFNGSIYHDLKQSHSDSEARWVAQQAFWYFAAFVVTWTPSTVWSALHYKSGGSFGLDLTAAICEPLAGLWNLLIFLSNRPTLRKRLIQQLTCQKINQEQDSNQDGRGNSNNKQDPDSSQKSKRSHNSSTKSNNKKREQSKESNTPPQETGPEQAVMPAPAVAINNDHEQVDV